MFARRTIPGKYRPHRPFPVLLLTAFFCILLSGAGCSESAFQVLNSSGNRNIRLSVDPIRKTQGYSAVVYDSRNGMPTSEANAIAQTGDGFIWIGNYSGLIRYDGNTFEKISAAAEIENVRSLFVDHTDRLWIGTNDAGVYYLSNGQIRKLDGEGSPGSIRIRSIAEDPEGRIYLGSLDGLYVADQNLETVRLDDERLSGQTIDDLRPGADGLVYGLTMRGDLFTVKDGAIHSFLSQEECRIPDVSAILPDPRHPGRVYIGTKESMIYIGDLDRNFPSLILKDISPLSYVSCMESFNGEIWICAENGIGKIDSEGFKMFRNAPMNKQVRHIMTDFDGNLWFTSSRQGVMKIVPNRFFDLYENYGLENAVVNSTCMLGDDLFIGTDEGLTILRKGKKLDSFPLTGAASASGRKQEISDLLTALDGIRIRSVIRDSRERLWISTWHQYGLLCYDHGELIGYTTEDGLLTDQVRTVSECADGTIIAATNGGVCLIRDGAVTAAYGRPEGISVMETLTVTEGFRGEILAGSDGGGIYVIDGGSVRKIGTEDGLSTGVVLRILRSRFRDLYWLITGNSIACMTPDYRITTISQFPCSNNYDLYENSRGDLWILSSVGIYMVSADEMLGEGEISPVFWGISSGLPCIATVNSFSEMTRDGDLYVSGTTGVFRMNIDRPPDDNQEIRLALPSVEADGRLYYPDESGKIAIPGSVRKLTILPNVISYSLNEPQISYRLEGFDQTDTEVSRDKFFSVNYTNLGIGMYSFVLTVRDPVARTEQSQSFPLVKGREMSAGTFGTIILSVSSLFLTVGLMVYTSLYRKRGRLEDGLFSSLLLSNVAFTVGELLTYSLERSSLPFAGELVMFGCTLCYAFLTFLPYLLFVYLFYLSTRNRALTRKVKIAAGIPCLLFFAGLLLNLATGWLFTVSDGSIFYFSSQGFITYLPFLPVIIYLIPSLVILCRSGFRLGFPVILLLLVRLLWELWYPAISSTSFSYTLLLVCMHLYVMSQPMYEEEM